MAARQSLPDAGLPEPVSDPRCGGASPSPASRGSGGLRAAPDASH